MKAQGISLITLGGDQTVSTKATKASDATFDSFMSNHAEKVSTKSETKEVLAGKNEKTDKPITVETDAKTNRLDTKTATRYGKEIASSKEETLDTTDVSEMIAQTMVVLQNLFGLSEEELTDVMEQLGMQVQDLLFQMQDGAIALLNTNAIQQFVMGIHGVEDAAVLLTNDALSQEMNALTEQITTVLAEGFGIEPEQLADLQKNLSPNVAEQISPLLEHSQEMMVDGLPEDATVTTENVETMPVIVEQEMAQNENDSANTYADDMEGMTDSLPEAPTASEVAPATFTENLAQALEKTDMAKTMTTEQTMTHIVEQVVRQVRIRVMPETTSMELQLNPASLGRVNITVATTAGVATATMVVENEIAKEALESQMITLKETFAEQGLKVEEVEVTVGEFSMKKENEQQEEPTGGKKQHRRFRADDELAEDDESVVDTNMTASERRDIHSVVDYTA